MFDRANAAQTDPIVSRIEELIVNGTYPPGAKLREQALAAELGIGRGPLREAIRTLEARRLLLRIPNAGVQVAGATREEVVGLLYAREALEGMAARLAAENMTASEVQALRDSVSRMETDPDEVATGVLKATDDDFHRLVAKGSRNVWLEQVLLRDLHSLLKLHLFKAARRPNMSETIAEHRSIIERIHARDGEGAEAAMRLHIRRARERMLRSES